MLQSVTCHLLRDVYQIIYNDYFFNLHTKIKETKKCREPNEGLKPVTDEKRF